MVVDFEIWFLVVVGSIWIPCCCVALVLASEWSDQFNCGIIQCMILEHVSGKKLSYKLFWGAFGGLILRIVLSR